MKIINTVEQWKEELKTLKDKVIGFVPTMGALHEGHLSLINESKKNNQITVVSIYLNPTQFNDKNDLTTYPSNLEEDIKLLEKNNVDYLFTPTYSVMYPDDYKYKVQEDSFSTLLCGKTRPGHFTGVLTVVMKLFNIIKPTNAYFGEKDYQQYVLLKEMVKAFFMDINLVPCPIIRQKDGLALSSRNKKLSEYGIKQAPKFHEILVLNKTIEEKKALLEENDFIVDYIEEHEGRLYAAVFLEDVRLIDNV